VSALLADEVGLGKDHRGRADYEGIEAPWLVSGTRGSHPKAGDQWVTEMQVHFVKKCNDFAR